MLEVGGVGRVVCADEFAGVLGLGRHVAVEELDEAQRLILAHKVEVHAVAEGLCVNGLERGDEKKLCLRKK